MPGRLATRYTIAVAQMLTSALLIHLTGGRIETHFHVFGSLAFLALYRDWRVLVRRRCVIAADHLLRGVFWPQSVYGVVAVARGARWSTPAGSCSRNRARWRLPCAAARNVRQVAEHTASSKRARSAIARRRRNPAKASC